MQLSNRASKKYSNPNAWHNQFYSLVTTKIDEEIFKPLFPEGKKSRRPNASIRVIVGMSILKEGYGCSDEDLYADGAYQSPENHEFAKYHDDMQLKTGKMQGGCRWELIPYDDNGLTVRDIETGNTYEAVTCSSKVTTHATAIPDIGACLSTASMHIADACG